MGHRRALPRARALRRSSSTRSTAARAPGRCSRSSRSRRSPRSAPPAGCCSPSRSSARSGSSSPVRRSRRRRYLPRLASGEWLPRVRAHRSRAPAPTRRRCGRPPRRDGDEYVLNGSKRFITNAGVADLYTVFAKTDPDAGPLRASPRSSSSRTRPGFAVARLEPKMGISGSTTGELDLRRLPDPRREPARRGGRGLQDRDADPRPLAPRRRRAGARDRAGRDRLRARVREDARDDGQADRPAPADRGEARRHGDRRPRRRAGSSTASARCATTASTARS